MITLTIVGERIEVDVFDDGHIEYSRFKGDESVDNDWIALLRFLSADDSKTER